MGRKRIPVVPRFWSKVDKRGFEDCWLWTAPPTKTGYGKIGIGGSTNFELAHRFSWEIHFGKAPQGLQVCHKCDKPLCVNPNHLFLGTQGDNNRDRKAKGRGWLDIPGGRHPKAKLSNGEVQALREAYASGGITMVALAKRYRVGLTQVSRIVNRKERLYG